MSITDLLDDRWVWEEFYSTRLKNGHLSPFEIDDLRNFIDARQYIEVVERIRAHSGLSSPEYSTINKVGTSKKRLVFTFPREENYVLKLISHLLYKYDDIFSCNLYSFRRNVCVKQAVGRISSHKNLATMYGYKVDIHDYFNSVNIEKMLPILHSALDDDKPLFEFFKLLLTDPYAIKDGKAVECKKGIMAGMPVSGFFANLYLAELDKFFYEQNILYARYSDDIIVFAKSEEALAEYRKIILDHFKKMDLSVNPQKEILYRPHDKIEFLGFSFENGKVSISDISVQKMKDKIRRKARALYRWHKKKGLDPEKAIKAFIRHFNKKLYSNPINNEMTWCRWYFPVITTDCALKEIERYMLEYIRYIPSGRHSKSNYRLRYDKIKSLGYISLVNSYYRSSLPDISNKSENIDDGSQQPDTRKDII